MCDVGEIAETALNVGTFGTYGVVANTLQGKNAFADGNFGYFDAIGGMGSEDDSGDPFSQGGYMRRRQAEFDKFAEQYENPEMYNARLAEQMATSRARIGGQFANVGLAGSSASIGAMNESDRLTQLDAFDRQLRDRATIESVRQSYITGLNNMDIARLNNENANKAADNQMIGSILGLAGTAAGAYFGGPMGAAAGSQSGKLVPGQNYTPMAYQSPSGIGGGMYDPSAAYGSSGNYWGNNPYANAY